MSIIAKPFLSSIAYNRRIAHLQLSRYIELKKYTYVYNCLQLSTACSVESLKAKLRLMQD